VPQTGLIEVNQAIGGPDRAHRSFLGRRCRFINPPRSVRRGGTPSRQKAAACKRSGLPLGSACWSPLSLAGRPKVKAKCRC